VHGLKPGRFRDLNIWILHAGGVFEIVYMDGFVHRTINFSLWVLELSYRSYALLT